MKKRLFAMWAVLSLLTTGIAAPAPIPPTTSGENGSVTRSKLNLVYQYVRNNQVDVEALESALAAMDDSITNYLGTILSVELALKQDAATAATTSQLNMVSNALVQAMTNINIGGGDPLALTTNTTITVPTYLVVSNGLVYAMTPAGTLVEVTYYLPMYTANEPTTDYPSSFTPYEFEPSATYIATTTPYVNEWIRQGSPDDTITLSAENLNPTNTIFLVYDGEKTVVAETQILDGRKAAITLPETLKDNEFYLAWGYNQDGFGEPIPINQADLMWANPRNTWSNRIFRVYGQNLILGDSNTGMVYCAETDEWLTSTTNSNPYYLEFETPDDWTIGTYTLYAHNGHGGPWGWDTNGVTITYMYRPNWSEGTVFDATAYGANGHDELDDQPAIQSAIDAAKAAGAGNSVYLPEGRYMLGTQLTINSKYLRIFGDGPDSIISGHPSITNAPAYYGYLYLPNEAQIEDLTIDVKHFGINGRIINLGKCSNTVFKSVNVSYFPTNRTSGISMNGIFYGGGTCQDNEFSDCVFNLQSGLGGDHGIRCLFKDCEVIGSMNMESAFYCRNPYMSAIDCSVSPFEYDASSSITNRLEGRLIVGGGKSYGVYAGGNIATNLNVGPEGDQNSGEMVLFESGGSLYQKTNVTMLSPFSVSWPELTNYTSCSYNKLAIVDGKGLGQSRVIINNTTSGTVVFDEPFRNTPDSSSVFLITKMPTKVFVYKNELHSDPIMLSGERRTASTGFSLYGAGAGVVFDGNTIVNAECGFQDWAFQLGTSSSFGPLMFNLSQNNTIDGTKEGIRIIGVSGIPDENTSIFGNLYRNNIITNIVMNTLSLRKSNSSSIFDMYVFEHNSFSANQNMRGSPYGNVKNFLFRKNNFETMSDWYLSQLHDIKFVKNTLNGAEFTGLPSKSISIPKRAIPSKNQVSLPIYNQGSSTLTATLTSDSSWVNVPTNVTIPGHSNINVEITCQTPQTQTPNAIVTVVVPAYSFTNHFVHLNGTTSYIPINYNNLPGTRIEARIRAKKNSGTSTAGGAQRMLWGNQNSFPDWYVSIVGTYPNEDARYRVGQGTSSGSGYYNFSSLGNYISGFWETVIHDQPNLRVFGGEGGCNIYSQQLSANINIGCNETATGNFAEFDLEYFLLYESNVLVRSYYAEDAYGTTLPDRTGNYNATMVNCVVTNEIINIPATTNTFTVVYGTELGLAPTPYALPNSGMLTLPGLDYSTFDEYDIGVVPGSPTLPYDVYEWTRIADEDGVIITSGGDQ